MQHCLWRLQFVQGIAMFARLPEDKPQGEVSLCQMQEQKMAPWHAAPCALVPSWEKFARRLLRPFALHAEQPHASHVWQTSSPPFASACQSQVWPGFEVAYCGIRIQQNNVPNLVACYLLAGQMNRKLRVMSEHTAIQALATCTPSWRCEAASSWFGTSCSAASRIAALRSWLTAICCRSSLCSAKISASSSSSGASAKSFAASANSTQMSPHCFSTGPASAFLTFQPAEASSYVFRFFHLCKWVLSLEILIQKDNKAQAGWSFEYHHTGHKFDPNDLWDWKGRSQEFSFRVVVLPAETYWCKAAVTAFFDESESPCLLLLIDFCRACPNRAGTCAWPTFRFPIYSLGHFYLSLLMLSSTLASWLDMCCANLQAASNEKDPALSSVFVSSTTMTRTLDLFNSLVHPLGTKAYQIWKVQSRHA